MLFEGYRTEDFEGIEKLFEIKDAYEQQKLKEKEAENDNQLYVYGCRWKRDK